ncbi:helix-turn-helix domain-containing protein [Cellulomonas sp.]|uniref:helix-turn-helix domain-containing protein n=1 Tax=Cellulomonas sp. TaxID=40001 RepID=UPI003BA86DF8
MTASRRQSLVEERESTPEGRLAMAGARAAVSTVTLINRALDSSGLNQAELATVLEVTPGRVSQVVNGDGNLRVSTIARFLRAAGYRLKLTAEPADAGVAPLREPVSRRPQAKPAAPRYAALYTVTTVTDQGVGPEPVVQLSRSHPGQILDRPANYSVVLDMETGLVERPTVPAAAPVAVQVPVSHG